MVKSNKNLVLTFAAIFLVSRLSFMLAGLFFRQNYLDRSKPFPSWTYTSKSEVLNVFTSWDSGFFYDIATKGYPRVENEAATVELTVPEGMWLKVFLGSGSIGEEKTALPSSMFGERINNTLFLINSGYEDVAIPLHYAYEGIPYCSYEGPIDYDRDVKVMGESLINPTACGNGTCDKSYVTYYSVSEGKVLYQEMFSDGDTENTKRVSGGFRPSGGSSDYVGYGCNTVSTQDIKYFPDPNYKKVVTPYPYMPLYSYLSKALSMVLGDVVLSGLVISAFMSVISVLFLYKFLEFYFDENICFWTAIVYILYPFGFGASSFLATGLFNALLFSALYFAKEKNTFIVAILMALLSITGISGVLALLPIFLIYSSSGIKNYIAKYLAIITTTAVTLLIHFYILKDLSGSWWVFLKARNAWFSGAENIFEAFVNYFRYADRYAIFESLIYVTLLGLCVWFVNDMKDKKLAPEIIVFMVYSFILPFSNGGLTSFPRFSLSNFVVFLAIGYYIAEKTKLKIMVLLLCYLLSLLFFGLWTISSRYVV